MLFPTVILCFELSLPSLLSEMFLRICLQIELFSYFVHAAFLRFGLDLLHAFNPRFLKANLASAF